MIPFKKGLVFGEFWYVTSQKIKKIQFFSSHIRNHVSVLPQASKQALGHQREFIQTLRDANHYMTAGKVSR